MAIQMMACTHDLEDFPVHARGEFHYFLFFSLFLVLLLAEALIQWVYSSLRNTRRCNDEQR